MSTHRSLKLWVLSLLTFVLSPLLNPTQIEACFWDRDTLAHEHRLAPGVLKVIAGDFARRSPVVYQLRAQRRPQQLKEAGYGWLLTVPDMTEAPPPAQAKLSEEALRWTDDLAVALDRLKRHTEGISLLKRVLSVHPTRYETHANLGTLFIHSGSFTEGLTHLKRAVEINPKAHFGREIIQIALVEYIITQRASEAPSFPLSQTCVQERLPSMVDPWLKNLPEAKWGGRLYQPKRRGEVPYIEPGGGEWMCLVMPRMRPKSELCRGFCGALTAQGLSAEEGLKGVLGMMRFSDHTHPALLEALGDLLLKDGYQGPNRLASMAYLQASRSPLLDEPAQRAYLSLAALSLVGHRFGLTQVDQELKKALKRADRLQAKIARDEAAWAPKGERQLERRYKRRYLTR